MQFSKITLALGLGLASSVLAIPQSSAVQIADGQIQAPSSGNSGSSSATSPTTSSGSTGAVSGSTSNSRSTSSSNTYTSSSSANDTSDSDGEDGPLLSSYSYYVSPQGSANAMLVNEIPDGQTQVPGSSGSGNSSGVDPLSLAGSENLNTYSYEAGQGSPYSNIPVSQIPDGQVQVPGSTSGQAYSNPSSSFSSSSSQGPSSYPLGAEGYETSDYEALQEMYDLLGYSSPASASGSTGSYSASSTNTNAYGEGQPQALTDTTYAVGAVPYQYTYTTTSVPEVEVVSTPEPLVASSQGGEELVSSESITRATEPALYEGSAARYNVAKVWIAVALFAVLMG